MSSTPLFIHLNVHSQYSLLESTIRLDRLVDRVKELHMPAVALTDTFNLFGAVHFYQEAVSRGVKPILGCEMGVVQSLKKEKNNSRGRLDSVQRLVLLAENDEGYQNLMRLSSRGFLEGPGNVPCVDKELLAAHSRGLIALSAFQEGEVAGYLQKGEIPSAVRAAEEHREIFGKGAFLLEVQDHGLSHEREIIQALLEVSKRTGILPVATNGVRYLKRGEAEVLEVLRCLGRGTPMKDGNLPATDPPESYLKSAEEMSAMFQELPNALTRTVEIAERCHVQMGFGKSHMPIFPVPDGGGNENQYLQKLCMEGLSKRFASPVPPEVETRLAHEINVIQSTGFAGYFLIVWDFVSHAKTAGIAVGPGRGSSAGSLAAYCLGITDVNPIQYGLLFERFINPERVSAPDIDVDVCDRDRDKVLHYIRERYGADRVAAIVTFGTMAARAAVRDVGRVLDIPLSEVDHIAKLIPPEPHIKLEDAIVRSPELKALTIEPGPAQKLMDYARALEGQIRHVSTHAAGVIIGNESLVETVPLCRGAGNDILTQYDMDSLQEVGLLKLDVLGLRTLTVIDETLKLVERTRGQRPDLSQVPLDDPVTYALLREAHTAGVFQLESRGMRDYLRKLEPSTLEDLIALLALYRPGPLGSDTVDDFIRRKKTHATDEKADPLLEPILRSTYGVILYQEQVMRIASELAGFTLGQADLLRRAMGKKNPDEMESMRGKFVSGAKKRGIDEDAAENLFDQMAKFAGYGFNKSHSAAYALLAFQTAYLKAHYPAEFLTSLLTSEIGNQDKISQYVYECRRMRVPLLPPDVNESSEPFSVTPAGQIRFSLLAIKNVGEPAVKAILEARESQGRFDSLAAFCQRVDMRAFNPKMFRGLILSGALDSTGTSRSRMLDDADRLVKQALALQHDSNRGQTSLFEDLREEAPVERAEAPEMHPADRLKGEKEALGFYLSGHPLSQHEQELEHYAVPLNEVAEWPDGVLVRAAGLILDVHLGRTRRAQETYARFQLEDLHAFMDVIVWPETYLKARNLITADRLVAVQGVMDRSGDKAQIVAREVIALEEMAVKWAKSVILKVNLVGMDEQALDRLKELCGRYPGKTHVTFKLQTTHMGEVEVEVGDERRVTPSREFLQEISQLLGEDSVEITV